MIVMQLSHLHNIIQQSNDYFIGISNSFFENGLQSLISLLILISFFMFLDSMYRIDNAEYSLCSSGIGESLTVINSSLQKILGFGDHFNKNILKYPKFIAKEEQTENQEKINELVFMLNSKGHVLYANEKTLSELEMNLDELIGENILKLYESLGNNDNSWFDSLSEKHHSSSLLKIKSSNGIKWFFISYQGNFDSNGNIETIIANGNDVTFLAESEVLKDFYSDKDQGTGLINQYGLFEHLKNLKNAKTAISFFIEILNFSEVINYYGHVLGDKLLTAIVEDMNSLLSDDSLIVRYTDQKFVILCTNCSIDEKSIKFYLEKLAKFTTASYIVDNLNLQVDKRIGYAVYPEDTDNFEEVITLSSIALKTAVVKNSYEITRFNQSMKDRLRYNVEIANRLSEALDNNLVEVFFQKAVNCANDQVFVIEELSRWKDNELGYIPPIDFFRVAKETNQLNRLERYMVKRTLDSFKEIKERPEYKDAKVNINISPSTLLDLNFFDFFNQAVEESGVGASNIYIEISESTFVNNIDLCLERINSYKEKGFLIALDDFGTEYSSLSILESVNFDIIKIDAHFVKNIDKFSNQEIIKMIRRIASQTQKEIVAEGVETAEQRDALVKLGCYIQQGYFHHRPENLIVY